MDWKSIVKGIFLFCAYIGSAKLGMEYFAFHPMNLAVLWIPSGIGLIGCLFFGYRFLPFVWIASFIANKDGLISSHNGLSPFLLYLSIVLTASVDAFQSGLSYFFWTQKIRKNLNSTKDNFYFIVYVSFLSSLISIMILGVVLNSFGYFQSLSSNDIFRTLLVITFGDTIGIFITVPLFMAWRKLLWKDLSFRLIFWTMVFVIFQALVVYLFPYLFFLSFLVLIYLGYRFQIRGVTLGVFFLYLSSIMMTRLGIGPFVQPNIFDSYIYLISFLNPYAILAEFITLQYQRLLSNRFELEKKVYDRTKLLRTQIFEKNQAIEALHNSENLLSESNRTKDVFFSIIAHDLRNPLGSFKQITELLYTEFDTYSDSEKKETIFEIQKSASRVYGLLEQLLDWARTQTGNMPFRPTEINLRTVVSKITDQMLATIQKKGIQFLVEIPEKFSFVYADSEMIQAVLRNLISNSIKFTNENGYIQISASHEEDGVRIECKDNGVGMDSSDLEKLFRLDAQLSRIGLEGEKGTGLGLILCHEFIKLHGGEIWAKSEKGKGTTVSFRLPDPV
ncbi:Sensor histidine kinase of a two component complex [Leptospira biflexa serovar Patoc strain 'Patoc 1 (Ames)']|uniref:histidine kinase n=1 Tax=Leptospira biflexa serovar Patoc (strain Patoc 1 / ATCC 23582 / Paris) TaxID=456481 RepID=B0SNN4_LEPBP|nr:ATP-binding protein [Leptospira biflexa]ABZ93680.1 Sensor histidine kinase of a two component complex [Leptospira biflexa serovar Patoc strain 'Patoc 1 (Ames)']ABZ97315.1 Putative two-component sensor; putative membrane protein [Leptospira biflexa serovar Patoc strain 'Patoc 1 (Paris)']